MLNAKDWLVEMLSKRGLSAPDGRMLFKYRLSQEEYVSARDVLHVAWLASSNSVQFLSARTTCALFVLYAAEWWRREYAGGPWRWTPIVQSFVLTDQALPAQDRTHALIRGIHHWRHLPGSEGKKYFGVLVAHGGLPMRLISQGGSKIRAVLSSALRLALRYRWEEAAIEAAIAERADELSQPLRHAEIYALMARIVVVILELRHEFSLAGLANPISELDAKDPLWRDRFPLSLDEMAAQQLLSGLVDEAAQPLVAAGANAFHVERLLRATTKDRFELYSFVRHPSEMAADVFASTFALGDRDVPRYFTVDVQVGDRQPLCTGRQILGSESATLNLVPQHPQWRGEEACREHLMYVRSTAGELADGAMPAAGGSAISPEDPWIFAQRDEQSVLVSTGSARLPEQEAVVVCAASWRLELADPGSIVRPLGKCIGVGIDLDVFSIVGDVRIIGHGATYRLRTGQGTNAPSQYAWEGRRLAFQTSSLPVYAGCPKLYRYSADGERSKVTPAQLKWYVGGQPDRPIDDQSRALGPVDVWLMDGEERQVRFKLVILDPAARVNFRSGSSEREGSVTFVGWGTAEMSVSSDGIEWNCSQVGLGKCVNLVVDAQPPQSVAVSMKWAGSPREVNLTLPFPATGGRFFGAHGEAMSHGAVLPLQSMQGARLRIFDQNPQAPKQYKVRLTLGVSRTTRGVPRLESEHDVYLDRDGTGEVRLIDLQIPAQRLMGFSDELDTSVCMSLHAGPTSLGSINITRYAATLSSSPAELRLSEADLSLLDLKTLAQIGLCAHAFTHVGCAPIVIAQTVSDGTPTGVWPTTMLDERQAPWLLAPTADSSVQFRPVLWAPMEPVEAELPETMSRGPLGEAMAIGDADERFSRMSQVIAEMSADFAHTSWSLLEQNLAALRHLPLASLDSWRTVARNPTAAVACALRLGCSDSELLGLVRQLRDELGLVWELTSITMWSDAAKRLKPHYAQSLGEDLCAQVFPSFFAARIMLLSSEIPALTLPMQLTLLDAGVKPTADVINGMRQISKPWRSVADELWRGPDSLVQKLLLRAHSSETTWPNFGLTQQAISAFSNVVSEEIGRMAAVHLKEWLWLPTDRPDHRLDVANVPVICALWSVAEVPLDWWQLKDKALALKRVRGFDPLWFEAAYRQAILVFMAAGLSPPSRTV
ncbi:STY4851/ECs_5259 family protein [Variovorax atrisoli]|uniref:STY4851/ECs_5259 family protein n=1 Tax=Variovorax atrisoli TaxID=3394203 RepID=UPI003397EEE1